MSPVGKVGSPRGTALHKEVYSGSFSAVRALFRGAKPGVDMLDVRDHRGNTPLLLALKRGRADVASFLVHAGADVDVKSDEHFHLIDDAVSLGDVPFVKLAHARLQERLADKFDARREVILDGLAKLPNFTFVIDCKLTTSRKAALLAPLVAAMRIADTYTIRKRGTWLRCDSTVSGIDFGGLFGGRGGGSGAGGDWKRKPAARGSMLPSLQRGSISLVLVGREPLVDGKKATATASAAMQMHTHRGRRLDPGDLVIVDRVKRTTDSLLRRMRHPTAAETKTAVNTLLRQGNSPLYSLAYATEPLEFDTTDKADAQTGWTRHTAKTDVSVAMYRKSGVARHAPLSDVARETYFDPDDPLDAAAKKVRAVRKRVEVRVDTTERLPLGLQDILPVFEIAALHDDAFFAKIRTLLESSTLPRTAFPERVKVPLLLGVAARLNFTRVERTLEPAGNFTLPNDASWVVGDDGATNAATTDTTTTTTTTNNNNNKAPAVSPPAAADPAPPLG